MLLNGFFHDEVCHNASIYVLSSIYELARSSVAIDLFICQLAISIEVHSTYVDRGGKKDPEKIVSPSGSFELVTLHCKQQCTVSKKPVYHNTMS